MEGGEEMTRLLWSRKEGGEEGRKPWQMLLSRHIKPLEPGSEILSKGYVDRPCFPRDFVFFLARVGIQNLPDRERDAGNLRWYSSGQVDSPGISSETFPGHERMNSNLA